MGKHLIDIAVEKGKSPDEVVVDVLNSTNTQLEAAKKLGVSKNTVISWMKRFNIQTRYVLPETKNAQDQDKSA